MGGFARFGFGRWSRFCGGRTSAFWVWVGLCILGGFGLLGRFPFVAYAETPEPDAAPKVEPHGPTREQSGAKYTPQPSQHGKEKRELVIAASEGAEIVVLPISGTIDLGLAAFVKRVLSEHPQAAAFVLDINTLGGRVDAAIQIRDMLLEAKPKTIAFVHPRAISAGALISLACDVIAVSGGASIGAATPVQMGEKGAEPVEEKMVSYFRTEMRTTAEANGRRGDVAEAMVDSSVEIEGLSPAGKLLTLDTEGALQSGVADVQVADVSELVARLGLASHPSITEQENWAEKLVRFLTDPVVSGLLMSLGSLGILIELYTPGLGLPGALGVLSLSLFFGGHLLVNLAGLEELVLFLVGLSLLALEVLVIPGFGVAGVLGLLAIFASLALTLVGLPLGIVLQTGAWVEPLTRVTLALFGTLALMLISLRYLPKSRAARNLILASSAGRDEGFVSADESRWLGKEGVTSSELRPSGVVLFGHERVDVVSEGAFVPRGVKVQVVQVEGMRVVVRVSEDISGTT